MKEKIIYKIIPFELFTYILRILCVPAIILLLYNYKENPIAFSILMLVPLGILLLSRTSRAILTCDYLLIEHSNLLKRFSKVIRVSISSIESVEYDKEYDPPGWGFLPMGYVIPKDARLNIKLKDSSLITQTQIGSKSQFITLFDELNRLVNSQKILN